MVGSPGACQHHVTAMVFGVTPPERLFSLAKAQNRAAGMKTERITECNKIHNYKEVEEKGKTTQQVMLVEDEGQTCIKNTNNRAQCCMALGTDRQLVLMYSGVQGNSGQQ